MSSSDTAGDCGIVSRAGAGEAFRDALRVYVGTGRKYSVKTFARGIDIDPRTVEGWLAPVDSTDWRAPRHHALLSCIKFLGPDFASDVLAPAGLRVVPAGAYCTTDAIGDLRAALALVAEKAGAQ